MEGLVKDTEKGRYISAKADAKFYEKVSADTEGAEPYEYEIKDKKTGEVKHGKKYVLKYPKVENVLITSVSFETGEYGENVLVTLSDGENEVILAQAVKSKYGEDLLKKLPAIDFAARMTMQPYSFENSKGKTVQGINIYQKGDKVLSYFWDGEKELHGYPPFPKDWETYTSDEWAAHFLNVRIFLTKYNKEHVVPKFHKEEELEKEFKNPTAEEEGIRAEDIPFD